MDVFEKAFDLIDNRFECGFGFVCMVIKVNGGSLDAHVYEAETEEKLNQLFVECLEKTHRN